MTIGRYPLNMAKNDGTYSSLSRQEHAHADKTVSVRADGSVYLPGETEAYFDTHYERWSPPSPRRPRQLPNPGSTTTACARNIQRGEGAW